MPILPPAALAGQVVRAATYLEQNDDNGGQVMGADVTGEATGFGKKRGRKRATGQVRPGGKHRSGNWPLV